MFYGTRLGAGHLDDCALAEGIGEFVAFEDAELDAAFAHFGGGFGDFGGDIGPFVEQYAGIVF